MIYGDNHVRINERENPYDPHNSKVFAMQPAVLAVLQASNIYIYCINEPIDLEDLFGNKAQNAVLNQWHRGRAAYFQGITYDVNSPSFDLMNGNIGLGHIDVSLIDGGWEFENIDITPFKMGTITLGAEMSAQSLEINVSAKATAWTPSVTLKIMGYNIEISADIISIGAVIKMDLKNGNYEVGAAYLAGANISISKEN